MLSKASVASSKYSPEVSPLQVPCFDHSCSIRCALGMIEIILLTAPGSICSVEQSCGQPVPSYCGHNPCRTNANFRPGAHWPGSRSPAGVAQNPGGPGKGEQVEIEIASGVLLLWIRRACGIPSAAMFTMPGAVLASTSAFFFWSGLHFRRLLRGSGRGPFGWRGLSGRGGWRRACRAAPGKTQENRQRDGRDAEFGGGSNHIAYVTSPASAAIIRIGV